MCYPVTCQQCGKITWSGCGQHVAEVMRSVPSAKRCPGHDGGAEPGFFARIFGR